MADNNKKEATTQTSAKKQGQKKERTGLIAYLRGVKQEFSKVVWPTKEELTTDTVVVFACVGFFALMFWLIDTGFLAALKGILGITLS
jgi:preprotein translocase subunit SecE